MSEDPRSVLADLTKVGMALQKKRRSILWEGPVIDGITFSLLSRFLADRERFRIQVVEGLRPIPAFDHKIDYGVFWHACEEALAKGDYWERALKKCAVDFCKKYPTQQDQITHWYSICLVQFPIYVDYWSNHPDVVNRKPIYSERIFKVPYELPSGRRVILRGKWDSVDLVEDQDSKGYWLQENKSKGDIKELLLMRQLRFDLQTMLYLIALVHDYGDDGLPNIGPINGVRYNVVRRPLSGGEGTIRIRKHETNPQFYERLSQVIREDRPNFFMRWSVKVTIDEITKFRRQCLDPILESLWDWWEWVEAHHDDPFANEDTPNKLHWRFPYGCYAATMQGREDFLDHYLDDGSEVGLTRVDNLFPELES